jgi:hypothetical protein
MTRETYLDIGTDLAWVLDVHCKALPAAKVIELRRYPHAVVLTDNEDCPDSIDIYETASPLCGDAPIVRLTQDASGELTVVTYPQEFA